MCTYIPYVNTPGVCRACGKALTGRQTAWCGKRCSFRYSGAHHWSSARRLAIRRDGGKCVTCGSTESLEVNHIEPRVGKGYGFGCWNHPENLETLCHNCHVKVTNRQAAARRAK
jgi:5-methylcytosine-specific restriction endonuclease McrA